MYLASNLHVQCLYMLKHISLNAKNRFVNSEDFKTKKQKISVDKSSWKPWKPWNNGTSRQVTGGFKSSDLLRSRSKSGRGAAAAEGLAPSLVALRAAWRLEASLRSGTRSENHAEPATQQISVNLNVKIGHDITLLQLIFFRHILLTQIIYIYDMI